MANQFLSAKLSSEMNEEDGVVLCVTPTNLSSDATARCGLVSAWLTWLFAYIC